MTDDTTESAYARVRRVLWRQGPDRVLVRRAGGEAFDLLGLAAMVWVALDAPSSLAELTEELAELVPNVSGLEATLHDLVVRGLVEVTP